MKKTIDYTERFFDEVFATLSNPSDLLGPLIGLTIMLLLIPLLLMFLG